MPGTVFNLTVRKLGVVDVNAPEMGEAKTRKKYEDENATGFRSMFRLLFSYS
jgi:hypothetical protein